jgi:hypothetical protein
MTDDSGIEIEETIDQGVDADGTAFVEDTIRAVDPETGDELVDDTVVSVAADGTVTTDEVVYAVRGEDGAAEVLGEALTVADAEGSVTVVAVEGE